MNYITNGISKENAVCNHNRHDYIFDNVAAAKYNDGQIMNEIDKKWAEYNNADTETKRQMTDHSFEFIIDDIGSGWEYVRIVLDGNIERNYRVSYIGPTVTGFVRTVMTLEPNGSTEFSWSDEPSYIEYPWLFSRQDDVIYVEAPKIENGFFIDYGYFKDQIRKGFEYMYKWEIVGID